MAIGRSRYKWLKQLYAEIDELKERVRILEETVKYIKDIAVNNKKGDNQHET